jgi:hypothetical protein
MTNSEANPYVSAGAGLLGVVVGGLVTILRDVYMQRRTDAKARAYLAIRVGERLERFAAECLDVIADTGREPGQEGTYGEKKPQAKWPSIEIAELDVNWQTLRADLAERVLRFPSQIAYSRRVIAAVWDHSSNDDTFEEWQIQFAELGVKAYRLLADLRANTGLPTLLEASEQRDCLEKWVAHYRANASTAARDESM